MARVDHYYSPTAPKANSVVPSASAVVLNDQGHILLHRRSDNNLWSLPGGALDLGESIKDTIIREVKEETGFDVDVIRVIGIYTNPNHVIEYTDGEVRQQFSVCFECRIIGGKLEISSESKELRFFTIDEILNLDLHPAQKIRIEDYLKCEKGASF